MWLALHLPLLPLHALGHGPHEPRAVTTAIGSAHRLYCVSPEAYARGLRIGMATRSAQALAPDIPLHPRQESAEHTALSHLGTWGLRFSSQVTLSAPATLALEIGGSLRLFGGLAALLQRIQSDLQHLGHVAQPGLAPTIRGAELLARSGVPCHIPSAILSREELRRAIDLLPLEQLQWPAATEQKLRAVGLTRVGECLRLPRAGFSKRYGAAHRLQLDQITGEAPDPRPLHQPPPLFQREAELFFETERTDVLLPGFERLFADLAAYLYGRDCGLTRIHITLHHPRCAPTQQRLGLQKPSRDPAHWLRLLEEKLTRLELPEPVRKIAVQVDCFDSLPANQTSLFPEHNRSDRSPLLETLSARLGPSRIYAVDTQDDHRPEYAWQRCDPETAPQARPRTTAATSSAPRPLWLKDAPEPIAPTAIQLQSTAERIESGWWDGRPCRRDYYRARNSKGQQLWVYREFLGGAEPPRWFVHGYFG